MKLNMSYVHVGVLMATTCLSVDAKAAVVSTATVPTKVEVQKAANKWILNLKGKTYKATIRVAHGIKPLPNYDRLFEIHEGPLSIGLGFKTAPKPTSTLAELQKSLSYIALDQLPVPGIKATAWQTTLQTPISSFTNGVIIESWAKGVLRIRVKTRFFAIYGYRTDIDVPADAPMPESSYFQIPKSISADLTIVGKFSLDR
jgi:hypothetical protein